VRAIYAHHVLHGVASFEEVPPSIEELAARRESVLKLSLPYLVAELGGAVVGYCYAGGYRARPAYRYTVEDSVYVAEACRGRGIGTLLLGTLLDRCERGRWRQMVAVISDLSGGSVALHRRFGFESVGTLTAVGYKFGGWLDTLLMQRPLAGAGPDA
jgi:phosphinothricin acetyltransferase